MIDLHSHLLPGVDDGSRSVGQTLTVLKEMARHGITDICLTPHLLASEAVAGPPPAHEVAFRELVAVAPPIPRLHRGAEIMMDDAIPAGVAEGRKVTLAGTRYLLVEFPRSVSFQTTNQALSGVRDIGLRPVVAHPERYACCSVDVARQWRALGACIQVDATTLLGLRTRGVRARELVSEGLADILASDNHGDGKMVSSIFEVLTERGGETQAGLLMRQNPGRILQDTDLIPVPPLPMRESWWERMRGKFER